MILKSFNLIHLIILFLITSIKSQEPNQKASRSTIKDLEPIKIAQSIYRNLDAQWNRIIPTFEEYIARLSKFTESLKNREDHENEMFGDNNLGKNAKKSDERILSGYLYNGPKDRFNYASKDCAANIMETNPGSKNAPSILDRNKDRYLLDKCESKRFFVVELCQEIEIQLIMLANFEFFSSTFRKFNLFLSDTYPPQKEKGWYFAGTYEALNLKNFQAFDVNIKGYMKYVKIEFLEHYGNEYYCPISQIKVFGPTMLSDIISNPEDNTIELNLPLTYDSEPDIKEEVFHSEKEELAEEEIEGKEIPIFNKQKEIKLPRLKSSVSYIPKISENNYMPTSSWNNSLNSCMNEFTNPFTLKTKASASISLRDQFNITRVFEMKSCERILTFSSAMDKNNQFDSNIGSITTETSGEAFTTSSYGSTTSSSTPAPHETTNEEAINKPNTPSANGPENVFRVLTRRLNALETNYKLLQSYIDTQANAFNQLFAEIDEHHQNQFQLGFNEINTNMYTQFNKLQASQDELFRLMKRKLEASNQKHKADMNLLERQISLLSNEVLFGKRLQMAQLAIIFIVVVVILLVQVFNSSLGYFEVQNKIDSRKPSPLNLNQSLEEEIDENNLLMTPPDSNNTSPTVSDESKHIPIPIIVNNHTNSSTLAPDPMSPNEIYPHTQASLQEYSNKLTNGTDEKHDALLKKLSSISYDELDHLRPTLAENGSQEITVEDRCNNNNSDNIDIEGRNPTPHPKFLDLPLPENNFTNSN